MARARAAEQELEALKGVTDAKQSEIDALEKIVEQQQAETKRLGALLEQATQAQREEEERKRREKAAKKANKRTGGGFALWVIIPIAAGILGPVFAVYTLFFMGPEAEGRLVLTLGKEQIVLDASYCTMTSDIVIVTPGRGESVPSVWISPQGNSRYSLKLLLADRRYGKLEDGQRCKKYVVKLDRDEGKEEWDKGELELDCPVSVTETSVVAATQTKAGSIRGRVSFSKCSEDD